MKLIKGWITVLAVLLLASSVWGGVPQTINYQGYLKKADGTPVTTTTRVVFSIYKDQTGGEPIWQETHNLDPDVTGRYAVVLGSKQPDGLPAELLASSESRWVGVRMEWDTEQSRVLLVSVPYALKAGDAETVGGKPLSAFVLAGTTSGTGSDGLTYLNPTAPAPAGGTQTSPEALPQESSGTIGYIGKFVTSTNLGNSAIYQSTTANRIGIGTTSPLAALHLVSPSGLAGYLDVYSGAPTTALGSIPLAQRGARGTKAAPSAVKTNDYLGGISAAGYGTAFSGARGGIALRAGENWTGTKQGTYIQFQTTPTGSSTLAERMRIAPNGNVGIGTSAPAYLLDVNGTGHFTGAVKFGSPVSFAGAQTFPAAGLTGTVSISHGGTGMTTAPTATGQFLRSTGVGAWGVSVLQAGDIPSLNSTYVDRTSDQTIAGTKTFTSPIAASISGNAASVTNGVYTNKANTFTAGKQDLSGAGATLPVKTVLAANTPVSCTANKEMLVKSDATPAGRQLFICNGTGNGWNLVGDGAAGGVTSFNGRGGAVTPQSGDYNFSQLSGTVSDSQIASISAGKVSGTISLVHGGTGAGTPAAALSNLGGVNKAGDSMSGNLTVPTLSLSGNLNLPATTATTGIIKSGASNLIHAYGTNNFFAGINAGNLAMTGGYNTASGAYALSSNNTGSSNTASGYAALNNNSSGANNTASGYYALLHNTTGVNNTASGYAALYSNTTGRYNTASGVNALNANTSGDGNTASGMNSLYANTTGRYNTASGMDALRSNTTGHDNTASGLNALYTNTTGYGNTASGVNALYANTTGFYNTASGLNALYTNTTGYGNTALGYHAGYNYATGKYNTFIGFQADASQAGLRNATAIGNGAIVDASGHVRIGNDDVTWIGGKVGFWSTSDIRAKKDIEAIGYGIDFIKELRPVQFRWKTGNERFDFGFIAQDIEALLGTDYNVLGIGGDTDRTLSLRYTDFIAPMVKAMQEQQAMIDQLKAKVNEIDQLKAELAELKRLLGK
jgi:hypothetical protein